MAKDKELDAVSEKEKGDKKGKKAKKQSRIVKWFKDLRSELGKVVWPTKRTVFNNSLVVFVTMAIFAVFTFLLDTGFLKLLQFAISGKS